MDWSSAAHDRLGAMSSVRDLGHNNRCATSKGT
jgi:hypothetical protein